MNLNNDIRTPWFDRGGMRCFGLRAGQTLRICLLLCSCFSMRWAVANDPNTPVDHDNDLLLAKMPTTATERELWKARMKPADSSQSTQSKDDLKALMQQISAIKFKEIEPATEPQPEPDVQELPEEFIGPVVVMEPIIQDEPNEVVAQTPAETVQTEKKQSQSQISEQTLKIFRELLQQPEQLKNPYELAEVLFRSNCPKEAAICYQIAFDRLVGDNEDPHDDKAWILFQLGNCLEDDDPRAALTKYRTLVTEYPDCPWVDVAKAKSRIIDWQLKDNPVALIKECKS